MAAITVASLDVLSGGERTTVDNTETTLNAELTAAWPFEEYATPTGTEEAPRILNAIIAEYEAAGWVVTLSLGAKGFSFFQFKPAARSMRSTPER